MSIEVKSIIKDDDSGARVLRVKLSSSVSFETPTRTITSTEHRYQGSTIDKIKGSYGLGQGPDITFKNPIVQTSKEHTIPQLERFLKMNGTFDRAKKDVVSISNAYPDKFVIYYPSFTKKMFYIENQKIGIENLKTIIDFQIINCQIANVSIPESHPNQSFDDFKRDLNNLSKRAEAYGSREIIPYLDLGMDNDLFQQKYGYIIDSGYPVLGLAYRNVTENYPNFRQLQDSDDDILRICSGVDRYWRSDWTTSFMHLPNFWGMDIVSVDSRAAVPKLDPEGKPIPIIKPIEKVKLFDKDQLGLLQLSEHEKIYHNDLNCNCPVCSGKTLDQFISEYSTDDAGNTSSHILDKFCKVHEIYASYGEFDNEKEYLKQSDSESYIKEHAYLNSYFEKQNSK